MIAIVKKIIKSSLNTTFRKYIVWKGKLSSNKIALTFDDGPDPLYTPEILDILKSYEIPATFFLVGSKIAIYPKLAEKILQYGHDIGNHTYSHSVLKDMDKSSMEYEIHQTEKVLKEQLGYKTKLFRPPKGIISFPMIRICMKNKLKVVMWSIDPKDFNAENSQSIVKKINPEIIKGGDIILLHDKIKYTQEALPILIEELHKKGLAFSTVSNLL